MSDRNFNTISPSALALLRLKSLIDIPFAKEAMHLLSDHQTLPSWTFTPDFPLRRLIHFEARYRSIDKALDLIKPTQVLELSSGFSFRGLDRAMRQPVYYIDTDLPELLSTKAGLLPLLLEQLPHTLTGTLHLQALNALDADAFDHVMTRFPPGPVTIVNEGLLMYLAEPEKRILATIIHHHLTQRGGHWITGDIYVRSETPANISDYDRRTTQFLEAHQVEENKFEHFHAAKAFFESIGFYIEQSVRPDPDRLSSLQYLDQFHQEKTPRDRPVQKVRETWILKAA